MDKISKCLALLTRWAVMLLVIAAVFYAIAFMGASWRDRQPSDLEQRIERLESRVNGLAAASDYFHQEINKIKGD